MERIIETLKYDWQFARGEIYQTAPRAASVSVQRIQAPDRGASGG